jgi:hypothetical protein
MTVENAVGGMADLATEHAIDLDSAELLLGEDIAARYDGPREEVTGEPVIRREEQHRANQHAACCRQKPDGTSPTRGLGPLGRGRPARPPLG